MNRLVVSMMVMLAALGAQAADTVKPASAKSPISHDQPIEVSSDKLDVFQADHKAIFTGNVIAVQGTTNMRAEQMTVFYTDNSKTRVRRHRRQC